MFKLMVVIHAGLLALTLCGIASCAGQAAGAPMASALEAQFTVDGTPPVFSDASPKVAAAGLKAGGGGGGNGGPDNGNGNSCIACHPTPPEDENASWEDAPGDHAQCMECHISAHGNSPNPPNAECLDCHQETWEAGHDSSATDCLLCHLYPHLPNTDFSNCLACHTTPPENPEASWDDVVPAHAVCGDCHTGSHGWSPDYTDAFCVTCHPEYAGSGNHGDATCQDCHEYPHLMTMGWLCWKCHDY